jgi:hypothetical protein
MTPSPYTRVIRFSRVGLHLQVPDLAATVTVKQGHGGPYIVGPDLDEQIRDHVRPYLAHHGKLRVVVHPDVTVGSVYGRTPGGDKLSGPTLAEFTVHLPEGDASS